MSIRALGLVFPPATPDPRAASAPRVPPEARRCRPPSVLWERTLRPTPACSGRSRAPMRPARPGAPVPALLLLALVLAREGRRKGPGASGAHTSRARAEAVPPARLLRLVKPRRAWGGGQGGSDGSEPRWAGAA